MMRPSESCPKCRDGPLISFEAVSVEIVEGFSYGGKASCVDRGALDRLSMKYLAVKDMPPDREPWLHGVCLAGTDVREACSASGQPPPKKCVLHAVVVRTRIYTRY